MKATKANFTAKMEKLSTDEIIDLIKETWNDSTGILFREIGFEIIDNRNGEEESDRIYSEVYAACN